MRRSEYHGSFQHPVRAFLIGTGLVVLLLGGWVIGVEAGGSPSSVTSTRVITRLGDHRLKLITVTDPVVSTVVNDHTRIVHVPGLGPTRVVVVHTGGQDVVAYMPVAETGALTSSGTSDAIAPLTVYVPQPVTVTETVTETTPGGTVTETVTETDTVTVTAPTSSSTDDSRPPSS